MKKLEKKLKKQKHYKCRIDHCNNRQKYLNKKRKIEGKKFRN